jgi:hypothetical protein
MASDNLIHSYIQLVIYLCFVPTTISDVDHIATRHDQAKYFSFWMFFEYADFPLLLDAIAICCDCVGRLFAVNFFAMKYCRPLKMDGLGVKVLS